ncbi:hypothetical protein CPB83DRAFT_932079 [Crepidotus variabilis]|uniref:Uncharacterized protein n=1 Tax=Crepidotus variabilis TaxID=179855 RepID=A0A9P6E2I5_9AGAR|nr:hypothetical protein CPB83DRAFT_932079 [Crepidotus variabilis]
MSDKMRYCGDPLCRRKYCESLPYYDLCIYCGSLEEVALPWKGRIVDGGFCFIKDRLLCHLTNVPAVTFKIFDTRIKPEWKPFDLSASFQWPEGCIILLKADDYAIERCIGLQYFMRQSHDQLARYGAPRYPTPPSVTSEDDAAMQTEDKAEATDNEDSNYSPSEDEGVDFEAGYSY